MKAPYWIPWAHVVAGLFCWAWDYSGLLLLLVISLAYNLHESIEWIEKKTP